ncbi:hypothetical protein HDU79_009928, partial [Rhizoclosmatium sp. JEL0117]
MTDPISYLVEKCKDLYIHRLALVDARVDDLTDHLVTTAIDMAEHIGNTDANEAMAAETAANDAQAETTNAEQAAAPTDTVTPAPIPLLNLPNITSELWDEM